MKNFNKQFNFLEPQLKEEILKVAVHKTLKLGETVLREGQFISSFPLILHGLVKVSRTNNDGNELLLYYLHENEVCAMSLTCCMTQQTSSINAVTEEETEVLLIPREKPGIWTTKYPLWNEFVMQTFQHRFRKLIETLDAVAFMKLDQRVVKYFTDRHKKSGATTFTGTHQYLALQLNSSREVISRQLKKLEKKGKIEISRNFIDFSGLL